MVLWRDLMKKNKISKLWFFSATCFMIAGILDKDMLDIVFGCAFICMGCSVIKQKTNSNNDINK